MRWILPAVLPLVPLAALAQGAFYGPCIQADALANTPIGRSGLEASYRFRAQYSGALQSIRPYLIWSFKKKGYHAGSGGTLRVELQADDGSPDHRPAGQVLATCGQRMALMPASDRFYPQLFFDRPPVLKAGTLYHLVFRNTDPDPEGNFVSVNALFNKQAGAPHQPGRNDLDWAMLFRSKDKPAWVERNTPGEHESFTPILELYYQDGPSQGMGYIEFWIGAPAAIAGPARVRETFTVSGPARPVVALTVRVRHLAGGAPLVATLEQADGKVLATGRGDGRVLPVTASGSLPGGEWATFSLPGAPVLASGRTYNLVLSCPAGGRYEAFPMRKGTDKGFSDATLFADGHAECDSGSGWTGWTQWGQSGLTNSDLQFYFTCR
jgi:hypothetical protein